MATKSIPTPEVLRQLLDYHPDTGKLFWKERDAYWFIDRHNTAKQSRDAFNTRRAGKEAFTANLSGYKTGRIFGSQFLAHRVAWTIYYGAPPLANIDHINGIGSDNRIINLRDVSQKENLRNSRRASNNTSGHAGVSFHKQAGKWQAGIKIDGKRIGLGLFATLEEASAARKDAEALYGFHENHGRDQVKLAPTG